MNSEYAFPLKGKYAFLGIGKRGGWGWAIEADTLTRVEE